MKGAVYICAACTCLLMQFNKALRHTISWKVMNTVIMFCINLLLVRLLGAEQSGVFYYDITLLAMLALLQGFSLESGTVFFKSKKDADDDGIAGALVLWLVLQVFISAAILVFLDIKITLLNAMLYVVSNIAITYFNALFASNKIFLTPNIISAGVNFVLLAVFAVLYFAGKKSTLLPVQLYMYGFAAQALLYALFFYKDYNRQVNIMAVNIVLLKKLFAFSGMVFISNLLFFLLTRIDYYFVSRYCTAAALGNYIQVSKFGQLLVLVPSMVATVLFPYTAGSNEEIYLGKTQFYCRIITVVFVPLVLGVVATGFWLFPALFGDDFDMMYLAAVFYLPGFFALSIVTVLAAYTGGRGMIAANLTASALALVIVVVADVMLVPLCGINGAAIASSLAYIACMISLLASLRKKEYFFITDFFGLRLADLKRLVSL